MNIYKIWVDECLGYDTYDSAIVVAKDEETARHIHPGSTPGNPVVGYNAETYHYDKAWYESDDLSLFRLDKTRECKSGFYWHNRLISRGNSSVREL